MNLSQQNWVKEREELVEQGNYLRAEFEEAKQAMHNWEILAMEERSIRENLADKVADLEDQLSTLKVDYERATSECNTQSVTVDGLQRALQEIQTGMRIRLPTYPYDILMQITHQLAKRNSVKSWRARIVKSRNLSRNCRMLKNGRPMLSRNLRLLKKSCNERFLSRRK